MIWGRNSSTGKKDTIVKFRKRDKLALLSLASTSTAPLVGIDAIEAARTEGTSGACVLPWIRITFFAKWWSFPSGARGSCCSCFSVGHLKLQNERQFWISPATTTRFRYLYDFYSHYSLEISFVYIVGWNNGRPKFDLGCNIYKPTHTHARDKHEKETVPFLIDN